MDLLEQFRHDRGVIMRLTALPKRSAAQLVRLIYNGSKQKIVQRNGTCYRLNALRQVLHSDPLATA